ncbi:MAG: hypothetical protein MZV64_44665 [Ignavibacteriales bacterium]|nr:hypothetical protein [Ignavibacteriales bacterium]
MLMLVLRQPMRVALALISTHGVPRRHLRPARRALHRRLPGADLRRRGDGVHGLRDHAARRARPVVRAAATRALLLPGVDRLACCSSARSASAPWRGLPARRRAGAARRAFGVAAVLGRVPAASTGCTSSSPRCCWWRRCVAAMAVIKVSRRRRMDKVAAAARRWRSRCSRSACSASSSGATCW